MVLKYIFAGHNLKVNDFEQKINGGVWMEAVANLLELIVELLKRNYKKPKLWVGIIGILICIILIFPYIDSNTFYYCHAI